VRITPLGKWAPLKLTAIVSLPHKCSLLKEESIPQMASNENLRQNRFESYATGIL
jgi:hypothetical protein